MIALAITFLASAMRAESKEASLLHITHSAGYRHEVLELSQQILREIGARSGAFTVTTTEDLAVFTPEKLAPYAAILFFTSGELPLNAAQKRAFLDFVRTGHGFVGFHSATDTLYQWRGYLELIGGYFNDHPWHQKVRVTVADPANPLVAFLGKGFEIDDEIYQISDFDWRHAQVLLRLDPSSVDVTGDRVHPRFYGWPLAWTRNYGLGRVFYTALGHEPAVWRDRRYQQLIENGIRWAIKAR